MGLELNNSGFKEWQKRKRLTNEQMAGYLGISLATVDNYRNGRSKIPRTLECIYNLEQRVSRLMSDNRKLQEHAETQEAKIRRIRRHYDTIGAPRDPYDDAPPEDPDDLLS